MAIIIPQISFFDYSKIEILGDLERLKLTLDNLGDEEFISALEKLRGNGRNDYPIRAVWNSLIAGKVFGHRTIASLIRELSRNSQLRRACGFSDDVRRKHLVPPPRVYSRFIKLLTRSLPELRKMFENKVSQLYELLPYFGVNLAGDGKFIDSYAKTTAGDDVPKDDKRADTDAAWATKAYTYVDSDGKLREKKEYHFGFKAHILCDVATELPISVLVTPANIDEKKTMINMLSTAPEILRMRADTLALDRGYDSTEMIRSIKAAGISPVVDIRNCWAKVGDQTKQYKDTNMIYDFKGTVYFVDDKCEAHKMKYAGYDKNKKCLRYSHEGKIYKIYISYDERVFSPIARDSAKWERLYKGRTSVERLNGRIDRDFGFEDHCIRGLEKMEAMTLISLLIMNSMAVGKIKQGAKTNLAAVTQLPLLNVS